MFEGQFTLLIFKSHFLYKWKHVLSSSCEDGTVEGQCMACTLSVGPEPKSCMLTGNDLAESCV